MMIRRRKGMMMIRRNTTTTKTFLFLVVLILQTLIVCDGAFITPSTTTASGRLISRRRRRAGTNIVIGTSSSSSRRRRSRSSYSYRGGGGGGGGGDALHFMSNNNDDDGGISGRLQQLLQQDGTNGGSTAAALTIAIWTIPLDAIAIHWNGWTHFVNSVIEMQANTAATHQEDEFVSGMKFWILGAISHPIMDGAFGISEIMHDSPGPRLAGLVPLSFLLMSGVVSVALFQWEKLRQLAVSLTLALVFSYIGSGLDAGGDSTTTTSSSLLTDYNIQLDNDYQGRVVKGCPKPESVMQLTSTFDPNKYRGTWYWHKVHDWTQFHQMYDTTLDIRLTDNNKGYTNVLSVKGPSQSSAPLSWDKSPLLNGIRYSWKGTFTTGGVSKESGFGVSFPNIIIDATTNDSGDSYQELVQFQCIEVGGVRLYEGIDFMSRSPTMTEEQLDSMHQRVAILNPYGASPQQMHRIERQEPSSLVDDADLNSNEWQKLWKTLEVEKYLDQSLKE